MDADSQLRLCGERCCPSLPVGASGTLTAAAGRQLGDLGFGESRRRLRAVVVGWSWKHLAEGTEDGTGWETLEVGGR